MTGGVDAKVDGDVSSGVDAERAGIVRRRGGEWLVLGLRREQPLAIDGRGLDRPGTHGRPGDRLARFVDDRSGDRREGADGEEEKERGQEEGSHDLIMTRHGVRASRPRRSGVSPGRVRRRAP